MEQKLDKAYLGRGWSFPPEFNKEARKIKLVSEEEDVRQSLEILLSTRPGERAMQPNYGCNLDVMLFNPLTTTLITQVKDIIDTAIVFHEPRINVNQININTVNLIEGMVLVELDYTIRNTNSRFNFVYPFYLEEGQEVQRRNLLI